jgi:glycosyltransferase involved in cell wall biosynthesis
MGRRMSDSAWRLPSILKRLGRGTARRTSFANHVASAVRRAPFRLAVFADAEGATLQLNLLRPLAIGIATGRIGIMVVTEADVASSVTADNEARAAIAALFRVLRPHAVFVSRYGGVGAAGIAAAAQAVGAPLVFHLDDNLFAVPPELGPAKVKKYADPVRQAALQHLLDEADLVYLSTAFLFEQLQVGGQLSRSAFIAEIASASDPVVDEPAEAPVPPTVFGYMGSSTHGADLAMITPAIINVLLRHPDVRFELFGNIAPPPALEPFGARVVQHQAIGDYDAFVRRLAQLGWHFALAPLRDTQFNRAKTNTKWVEYASAGIPALISDHPIYRDCCQGGAGILVSDTDWEEAITTMIIDPSLRQTVRQRALERLRAEYNLRRLGRQVLGVLQRAGAVVPPCVATCIVGDS